MRGGCLAVSTKLAFGVLREFLGKWGPEQRGQEGEEVPKGRDQEDGGQGAGCGEAAGRPGGRDYRGNESPLLLLKLVKLLISFAQRIF